MRQQQFASPEEALEHFGIKGMRWGFRKDREPGEFANWGQPYSHADGLGHGTKEFDLRKPQNLRVDHSNGFADIRPVGGYRSDNARQVHDDLVAGLNALRDTYPAVRDLKIILAPGSHVYGGPGKSAQAAVLQTKPGEVFISYNDKMKDFSPRKQANWERLIPGTKYPGYVANHEMGHVLAVAGKVNPPSFDMVVAMKRQSLSKNLQASYDHIHANEENHKKLFKKHGVTFEELSKLSRYASTSPSEAFAELAGNYFTPQTNKQMSPALKQKAQAMFDDTGGKR